MVNSVTSFFLVPSKRMYNFDQLDQLMKPPPGFPSSKIRINRDEASEGLLLFDQVGGGVSFFDRLISSGTACDAIATRTCREVEGPFCAYLAEQFSKPVFLTGPALPEPAAGGLEEEKWANWLNKFEAGSVVYCAFGTQIKLQKDQFQELVLGFELSGLPFLVALAPPEGCATIEEALPEGFEERTRGIGRIHGGWVPQTMILNHPSTGCFVSHCGFGSMWESLVSECQIVLIPYLVDQIFGAKLMVEELKVAVEVERGEGSRRWVGKESLCKAIKLVMDQGSVVAADLKANHAFLRNKLSNSKLQEDYIDSFIQDLQRMLESSN